MDWSILKVALAVFVGSIPVLTFLWKVGASIRKVATQDNIKSLRDETERKVQLLKADTERDRDWLQAELRIVQQNFINHLDGHTNPSPAKNEPHHTGQRPPDSEELKSREKGAFTADEHDNRTRS